MNQLDLLQPMVALMLLTMVVWCWMYARRIPFIQQNKIDAQSIRTPDLLISIISEKAQLPAYNLRNLLEVPVLFYALSFALITAAAVDDTYMMLAWSYVILRAIHSAIQCTINIVVARFLVYALSCIVLWAMLIRFAVQLF